MATSVSAHEKIMKAIYLRCEKTLYHYNCKNNAEKFGLTADNKRQQEWIR